MGVRWNCWLGELRLRFVTSEALPQMAAIKIPGGRFPTAILLVASRPKLKFAKSPDGLRIYTIKDSSHNTLGSNTVTGNSSQGIVRTTESDDNLVQGNQVTNNVGDGVVITASQRNAILSNTVSHNNSGVRLSAGSANNSFSGNLVTDSATYGLYLFQGTSSYNIGDGKPTGNSFVSNTIVNSASGGLKTTAANGNSFVGNTFSGVVGTILFDTSDKNLFSGNVLPAGTVVSTKGTGVVSTTWIDNQPGITVLVNGLGAIQIQSPVNAIFQVAGKTIATTAQAGGSTAVLTSAMLGTSAVVINTLPFTVSVGDDDPAVMITPTVWQVGNSPQYAWNTVAGSADQSLRFAIQGLVANATYQVQKNGILLGVYSANSAGKLAFSDIPGSTISVNYSVTLAV
jgi:parallel beta-helix repeat protein